MDGNVQRFQKTYTEGLSQQEVRLRQEQGLTNVEQVKITKTNKQIVRDNLMTMFNAFNVAIGVCLAMVGAWSNMFYLSIIATNVAIGIVQEIRAKRMVEELALISALKADVVRDGREEEIPVDQLVLDDITILSMGKQITTDSKVVHGEIEANESLLTGEADPILKLPGDDLLSGSFVVSGKCYAQVEHVGAGNFAAKLAQSAKKHKRPDSELLRSMRKVTKFTGFFIIPIGVLLFIQSYFFASFTMYNSVISMAAGLLGMLPKGLVLLISVSLAAGVVKLSKEKVLVQELYSMETLARVDVICLDKTGTITEGSMRVTDIYPLGGSAPISAEQAIRCFVGASEDNNATFAALKEYYQPDSSYQAVSKISFSSARKWSAISFEDLGTLVLGAPEMLLNGQSKLSELSKEATLAQQSGERILCLGYCKDTIPGDTIAGDALPFSIQPLAAIAMSDPVRQNAKKTLDFFRDEGVNVKIISGDNPVTVSSIARQAGLQEHASFVDMSTVKTEEEIKASAFNYNIFGRVTPNQKSSLVKALKEQGHTVAMTGDGVNDVLALREADCSIAMGAGSDAARQVSQLVLVESDFSVIPDIVMEGRRVVNNITRVAGVFFIKTIYSVLLSIFSILTFSTFPFIPIQITLVDAAIEAFPAFALTLEPTYARLKGTFLNTVIRRALPYALTILAMFLCMKQLLPIWGISDADAMTTVIYFVTVFITIVAMVKSCYPFTPLRIVVCCMSGFGFYIAAWLFSGLLHLERLNLHGYLVTLGFALLTLPIIIALTFAVNKAFAIRKMH